MSVHGWNFCHQKQDWVPPGVAFWDGVNREPYGSPRKKITNADKTRIWCRDLHECQYCGARDKPLHIDHVVPKRLGGGDHDNNLKTACRDCNLSKGSKTLEEWRQA